jgi:hypothetical protein
MVTQIAYTNSNCSDVWEMFIKQNQKHTNLPLYFTSDKIIENYDVDKQLVYDNKDPYYQVWINAVKKFGGDYFIYLQEDFILYNDVNEEKINEYIKFLHDHSEYSFVRLLKSGNLYNKQLSQTLYEIEYTNTNIFAMQATIWRSSDYIKLMNIVKSNGWLETDADYRSKMISLNMMGAYHYDGENKRGGSHYDSNVYPYIATALVRGKWDMKEYGNELNNILSENNIDVNKRGIL